MADLTITAANVLAASDKRVDRGIAGATLTAGMPLYKDANDGNKLKIADADASVLTAAVVGIALHAALAGQPIEYQTEGTIAIGATVAVGTLYVLSDAVGLICPAADLASTHWVTLIGIAVTTTSIRLNLDASGVQWP